MALSPPPRALLLDLGNVLTFHDNALLFRRLGARAGLDGEEVQRRLMGPAWDAANRGALDEEGIRQSVCGALGVELSMEAFAPLWSCHFRSNETLFPLLESLSSRLTLVLVSNTNALHWAFLQRELPVLRCFHARVASCEVGHIKPEPRIYEIALERAGCAPEEAAFFDDIDEYVQAARSLGVLGELFTTTARFRAQLEALGISPGDPV